MSEKEMWTLATDNLISEMKNMQLDKCINCLPDKQNKTSFRSGLPMRKKMPLKLMHTDVCYVDTKSHVGS